MRPFREGGDLLAEYADVKIEWVAADKGGRQLPVVLQTHEGRGYRPHFRVGTSGEYLGVQFTSGDPPTGQPGCEGLATVELLYAPLGVDYSLLIPGARFDVVEGRRVVAYGEIIRRYRSERAISI